MSAGSSVGEAERLPGIRLDRMELKPAEFGSDFVAYPNVRHAYAAYLETVPERTTDVRQECVADLRAGPDRTSD